MSLSEQEAIIQEFFLVRGFATSKISETDEQTPDFLVEDGEHRYIVEVKDKRTDRTFMELLDSSIPGEKTLPLGQRNRLSGIIRKGVEQINSCAKTEESFKLIWFALNEMTLDKLKLREGEKSLPFLERTTQKQLFATLYGYIDVEGYTKRGAFFQSGCFYFSNSDFFRYRQKLHAVLIQTTEELVFCINDLSEQYHKFCCTSLYSGHQFIHPSIEGL